MYEDLIKRIGSITDGKSNHARGKAQYYLSSSRSKEKFKSELAELCEKALLSGEWKPVHDRMINLW